jgi:predicted nucleic acid-binding protein
MTSSPNKWLVIDAGIGWRLFTPNLSQEPIVDQLTALRVAGVHVAAPTLWRYEVTSLLTKALHFEQLTQGEVETAIQLSVKFSIHLMLPDAYLTSAALEWTIRLRRAAAYDGFYLALAQHLGCELWTTDRRLVNAVAEPWVRLVGEQQKED